MKKQESETAEQFRIAGKSNQENSEETQNSNSTRNSENEDTGFLKTELKRLTDELHSIQGENPLMQPVVNGQSVAEIISGWTGIPIGKMVADEIHAVLNLHEKLAERVLGQDHALESIAQRIRTSRAGLTDPKRPIGVFLLSRNKRRRKNRNCACAC